jgi:hypothetical protein
VVFDHNRHNEKSWLHLLMAEEMMAEVVTAGEEMRVMVLVMCAMVDPTSPRSSEMSLQVSVLAVVWAAAAAVVVMMMYKVVVIVEEQ